MSPLTCLDDLSHAANKPKRLRIDAALTSQISPRNIPLGRRQIKVLNALIRFSKSLGIGVMINCEPFEDDTLGVYFIKDSVIVLHPSIKPSCMIRVLLHELTHVLLHQHRYNRHTANNEVEAESVAYIIGRMLHLPSVALEFSPTYIRYWYNIHVHEEGRDTQHDIDLRISRILRTVNVFVEVLHI